ncbi:MAG TPA: efflux RND transporter periplasmic adaptor subunit [bacterium]|nr:efflux RND transporter periplasmic adaptor subunit [bacterium]
MKHLLLFISVFVFLLATSGCSKDSEGTVTEKQDGAAVPENKSGVQKRAPRKVRIQKIAPGDITGKIFFNAVIEAERDVTVTSKTTGEIIEMNYDIGSFVKKGVTVAVIEYDLQRTALDQAELNLKQAELAFALKEKVFQRDRKLFENKAITAEQFDASENGYQSSELSLNQAKTSLQNATVNYNNCFIKAPFDGIVVERPVQQGQYVSIGTAIARIVDTANLQVVVGMSPDDLLIYKRYKNKDVGIILPNDQVVPGTVKGVADAPDRKTSLYSMKILFKSVKDENDKYIVFPGMQLKVAIDSKVHKNAFLTSRNNMRLLGNRYIVYIIKEGKAVEKEVEIVSDIGKERVVRFSDGYSEPSELIISGLEALSDGREVEVLEEK